MNQLHGMTPINIYNSQHSLSVNASIQKWEIVTLSKPEEKNELLKIHRRFNTPQNIPLTLSVEQPAAGKIPLLPQEEGEQTPYEALQQGADLVPFRHSSPFARFVHAHTPALTPV